ncbi:hypothetical protein ACQKLP_05235 [Chitinophaga sp. NPDC101104]|uniref:hypothetical protein n=1 Tax=Chitinophaga sp. NPDC101104 TaxID=3390561 RepID=UPI003D069BE5
MEVQQSQMVLEAVKSLESTFNGRIDALESRFDGRIDALGSKLDGRIDALESRFDGRIDALVLQVEKQFEEVGEQFKKINFRIDLLHLRMGSIECIYKSVLNRLGRANEHFEKIESRLGMKLGKI